MSACILHLSDLHFGTEQTPVVAAIQRLSQRLKPQLLIVSGDLTQRAQPHQFRAARRFIDSLAIPNRLLIPGNHDIPLLQPLTRLLRPYQEYLRYFGPELEPSLDQPQLLVLGVKTTRRYRHTDGELSAKQIERVARRLQQAAPEQLRLVVTHQPLAVIRRQDAINLLHRGAEASRRWAEAGADLVLGGHIHLPYVCAVHEQMPLARPLWVVQAGTAVSSRTRFEAGHSLNLLFHQGRQHCRVERWDFQPAQQQFVCVSQQSLTPGSARRTYDPSP